ncbi:translation initiation factor IF-2-like [Vidua chalybeata]|uniref:translation initiation factor IF-2-like n=1 Tax=Vidua chalybeata TaxID=81927 RepID=UPI0023A8227C|nr:translation initiation factor IF-2-like [Vidua chalybeata]
MKVKRALPGGRPAPFSPPRGGAAATRGELRSGSGTEEPKEGTEGRTEGGKKEGREHPRGPGCPQKGLATAARREAHAAAPPPPPPPHSTTAPAPRPRPARPSSSSSSSDGARHGAYLSATAAAGTGGHTEDAGYPAQADPPRRSRGCRRDAAACAPRAPGTRPRPRPGPAAAPAGPPRLWRWRSGPSLPPRPATAPALQRHRGSGTPGHGPGRCRRVLPLMENLTERPSPDFSWIFQRCKSSSV